MNQNLKLSPARNTRTYRTAGRCVGKAPMRHQPRCLSWGLVNWGISGILFLLAFSANAAVLTNEPVSALAATNNATDDAYIPIIQKKTGATNYSSFRVKVVDLFSGRTTTVTNYWELMSGKLQPSDVASYPITLYTVAVGNIPVLELLPVGSFGSHLVSSNWIDLIEASTGNGWRMGGLTLAPNQGGSVLASSAHPLSSLYSSSITWGDGGASIGLTNGVADSFGNDTPEGVVPAGVGSIYRATNSGAIFAKTSGDGSTGWTQLSSSGGGISQTNSWTDGGATNWTMIITAGLVTSLTHSP